MSRFQAHCAGQAQACAALGSAFTARLCRLLGARMGADHPVGARLSAWPNPDTDAVALRLAGGLHALKMAGDRALTPVYPPHVADDKTLWQAIDTTLRGQADFLLDWLNSAPQTNELRRSGGLIPAFHWLGARYDLPLQMSELGASAGLNMHWQHYALHIGGQVWGPPDSPVQLRPDWQGALPPHAKLGIVDNAGCDLNPIDPQNPASRARLHAYIWPDQPARHAATTAALDIAKTPPQRQDALDFLRHRLARPRAGALHIVYHSIFWQYLPEVTQKACTSALKTAGAAATAAAPLAWLSIEADATKGSAAMRCTLWPGNQTYSLGRMDFHGRRVLWKPARIND